MSGYDASEWKPGDLGTWPGIPVALCVGHEDITGHPRFAHQWGGFVVYGGASRLVCIDPEDAEQVERLASLAVDAAQGDLDEFKASNVAALLTDALREFARPTPCVEEPTGLGAVVEDEEGVRWVRHLVPVSPFAPWCDPVGVGRGWGHIKAVRILSPGVES